LNLQRAFRLFYCCGGVEGGVVVVVFGGAVLRRVAVPRRLVLRRFPRRMLRSVVLSKPLSVTAVVPVELAGVAAPSLALAAVPVPVLVPVL